MERSILHLDLDTFFVSVERLLSPELLKKPVLVGGTGGRGVVAACSYETRKFGVHSGMSMKLARQLCPEAICIKGNSSTYMKYSDLITEIINESVPIFEKTSVDEFYVDLTGMDRFFGNYAFATELRQRIIKESGLPISFGLSPNKTVSKVATGEAKPNNQMRVDAGFEKLFLAPLSIRKIPSVGKVTGQKLIAMGVERIKTIQQMPVEMLIAVLGKNGQKIWQRAQGIDDSLVKPYSERKSISSERTFNLDTIDVVRLKNTITTMVDTLCFQLRQANKMIGCVSIKIRYSDFQTHTKQCKIPYTSAEHIILPVVEVLFKSLYQRRILVRLIGIHFSDIVSGHYQIDLFDDNEKELNLYKAMDHLRKRFGASSVMRASTLDVKTIRSAHNPFDGSPPLLLAHRKA
ncbi:DNA polymerase IV [Leeuwenhoekiella polynyae]|uniref:DNA polymerase IV n=1 Tax=Leeuwenhoekiella polynyae TaxID=1550906 RepID=A0A4Q0NSC5_9FLAO|nr:DNA polymerase IV [Leeuwenhoekiella polynyae]RXG12846.1 DNA polymerase-4 [Leeuwenhoekiella polynyae]